MCYHCPRGTILRRAMLSTFLTGLDTAFHAACHGVSKAEVARRYYGVRAALMHKHWGMLLPNVSASLQWGLLTTRCYWRYPARIFRLSQASNHFGRTFYEAYKL